MAEPRDEFFIGYLPKAPASYASHVRVWAIVLVLAAVLGALLAASSQRDFDDGYFEFGKLRKFEGYLSLEAVPTIHIVSKTGSRRGKREATYLLVGLFKKGVPDHIFESGEGKTLEFEGTLIHRRGLTMVEITDPASIKLSGPGGGASRPAGTQKQVSLVGEIVDSKCFLGVRRPATGKVHRACAIRCISGGVPAAFLVRTEDGAEAVMLLAGSYLKPFKFDLDLVGVPVRIDGSAEVLDGVSILRPARITRITP